VAERAGLAGDLLRVAVLPHRVHLVVAGPSNHERSRERPVADPLADAVGLAGEQGLVRLQPGRGEHLAIHHDLVARAELEHVAEHDLAHGHGPDHAVAHHGGLGRVEHREPVEGALGPQLLDDPGGRVGDQDQPEQGVLERADDQDDDQQPAQQRVERGQQVGPQDLGDGTAGDGRDQVGPPGPGQGGRLGLG
jgi:hypothetical protein